MWCGCPESGWVSRRGADVRRALGRRVGAAGRGCIAGSRRGGGGEGRTFLLRRNVPCSIFFLENKFYFFFFFLKSVRAQGGREEERERGRERELRNMCRVPPGRGVARRSRGVARRAEVCRAGAAVCRARGMSVTRRRHGASWRNAFCI